MRESKLEKDVRLWAEAMGIHTRKTVSPSRRGFMDRLFSGKRGLLFLELKRPGEEPEPLQYLEIRLFNETSCPVNAADWSDNFEDAIAKITSHCLL